MVKPRIVGVLVFAGALVACGSVRTGPATGRGSIAALSSIAGPSAAPSSAPLASSAPPASVPPASIPATGSPFPAGSELGIPQAEMESDAEVLYAQNGVTLVAITPGCCGSQEGKPSTLWMTTDLRHWRDVTPPGSRKLVNAGYFPGMYAGFDEASFLNPTTGWVTTWNSGNLAVIAYRTSDGGKTWTSVGMSGHGDHAGDADWIQLLTPKVAFDENVAATAPNFSLAMTSDAGRSWHDIYRWPSPTNDLAPPPMPFAMPIFFVTATRGFAASGIPPAEGDVTGDFFATSDGGVTWSRLTPPSIKNGACPAVQTYPLTVQCLVSLPRFADSTNGVLATEVIDGANASVGFDVTRDAGTSWHLATSVDVALPVFPSGGYPTTNYAFVSMPSITT
ncbi:MAG TPA: hypothetical protein VGD55_10160, partial [Acidothermaceae bacterium]